MVIILHLVAIIILFSDTRYFLFENNNKSDNSIERGVKLYQKKIFTLPSFRFQQFSE